MKSLIAIFILLLCLCCSKEYRTDANGRKYFLKVSCVDMTCTETIVDTIFID